MGESKELAERDLAWVTAPGRSVRVRKGRQQRVEWKSDIPVILRNLAPQTGFNPGLLWEKEKAMEEAESKGGRQDDREEKKKGKGGGGQKKPKAGKSKEEIIAEQKQRAERQKYMRDIERLTNTRQNEGLSRVITLRNLETELGQLERLLMILADAVERSDKAMAYDVLWGIEAHPQYLKAIEEIKAAKSESKEGEKNKSKSKSSSSSKKSSDDIPTASEVLMKYKDAVSAAARWRKSEDMIVKQLTDMSDSLPPLSKFSGKFRLDNWQKQVLRWIDDNQSVVVAAPTSSGKTIISTYVAHLGRSRPITQEEQDAAHAQLASAREAIENGDELEEISDDELWGGEEQTNRFRVLFVVPTEPLVWQVAAHFNAHLLQGDVALVSNQMKFSPNRKKSNDDQTDRISSPPAVIVGTPLALESSLTKIRGYVRHHERAPPHIDRGDLPGGFDVFRWVVFDEVHSLDGDEGGALQRLVRLLNCNFLALSATIGNAEQLRDWMESVKRQQLDVQTITVHNMEHQGRFMNLQQHVWVKPPRIEADESKGEEAEQAEQKQESDDEEEETPGLVLVHPLAAATLDFLRQDGFSQAALPFTPRDSFMLWQRMCRHYPREIIEELDPHTYFAGLPRITLQHTKDYETALKAKLQEFATTHEAETEALLEAFRLPEPPGDFNILDLCLELKQKDMLPALAFHLNAFEAINLFQSLLHELEKRQSEKYPDYHTEREKKIRAHDAELASAVEGVKTEKEKEEIIRARGEDLTTKYELDEYEPHPEFCMQRNTLGLRDFEEIAKEVAKYDFGADRSWSNVTTERVKEHALLRGLRRGIALYIDEVTLPAYRRAVMKLAMQGKLAVVCSDSSLAYGVNMPFRTCIFCTEMQGLLDPLMAQQMSGRAGRRGLDTQGHLVYAGARAGFIREIMLGRIPAIHGRDPLHHFLAIPEILLSPAFHLGDTSGLRQAPFVNPAAFPRQMDQLGLQTLAQRIEGETPRNFMDISRDAMIRLGFVDRLSNGEYAPASGVRKQQLHLMWELRSSPAHAYLVGKALPFLYEYFIEQKREDVEEMTQLELFYMLLHLVERKPLRSEPVVAGGTTYGAVSLQEHPYRQERVAVMERLQALIADAEAALDSIEQSERLRSPVAAADPLDSLLFDCIRLQTIVHDMPSRVRYEIKEGIWQVGTALVHLHNCVYSDRGHYSKLQHLFRKCFQRLMYLTRELMFTKLNLEDVSNFENEKARLRRVRLQAVRKAPAKAAAK